MLKFAFSFVLDLEFGLFWFTSVWYLRQLNTEPAHTDPSCNHCLSVTSFLYSYLYLYLRRYTTGGGEGLTAGRRLLPDYYWLLATSTPEPSSTADQPHVQRQQLFFFWTLRDNSILQSTIHTWIPNSTLHSKRYWTQSKKIFFSFLLCYFASGCQHHLQFACRWKLWRKCDHPIWPGFANFSPQMRT